MLFFCTAKNENLELKSRTGYLCLPMQKWFFLSVLFLMNSVSMAQDCGVHEKRRVLIIGIDGATGNQMHYRALVQNKMPAIRQLMMDGEFAPCIDERHPSWGGHRDSRCARAHSGYRTGTDYRWLTGPGWLSVLTGVDNYRHGVKDNEPRNLEAYVKVKDQYPTLFMRAREKGLQTAAGGVANFLTSKGESKPGIVDYECGSRSTHWPAVKSMSTESCNLTVRQADDNESAYRDKNLSAFLKKQIQNPEMDVIMGVYDGVDSAGHHYGFSSRDGYLTAMTVVDRQIAPLLTEVRKRAHENSEGWLVVLTSDHGGHNIFRWGLHDVIDGEDDAVPFVLATYGSCQKLQPLRYPVRHMDVHPTVMKWLGFASVGLDGKVQGL